MTCCCLLLPACTTCSCLPLPAFTSPPPFCRVARFIPPEENEDAEPSFYVFRRLVEEEEEEVEVEEEVRVCP